MRVAIIGNGVAAHACATVLTGGGVDVTVVGTVPFHDRPPLSKGALGTGEPVELAPVDVVTAGEVPGDTDVVVHAVGLDYTPPFPAHVNATPEGCAALAAELRAPRSVVIVGAGLVGTETAATLAGLGHGVTLLDLAPRPLDRFRDPIADLAAEVLDELGVTFLGGTSFDPDALHPSDVVVAATGGRQRPGYPLETDASMRVDAATFAIGDCALPVHARFGRIASPHWTPAVATALVAARTILGEDVVYDELPYWWSDVGPRRIDEVGHAPAAATWDTEDGLLVGRDAEGAPVCVTLVDQPRRLRDARRLLT